MLYWSQTYLGYISEFLIWHGQRNIIGLYERSRQYPIITTKYHKTSEGCKHITSRNRNKHLISKWQLQNTDSRRYIQHIRRFTKYYPRRHGESNVSYSSTLSRWTKSI